MVRGCAALCAPEPGKRVLTRLRRGARSREGASAPLVCQFSSLGSLSEAYLTQDLLPSFFSGPKPPPEQIATVPAAAPLVNLMRQRAWPAYGRAAQPVAGSSDVRADAIRRASDVRPGHNSPSSVPVHFLLPTVEQVRLSMDGYASGGSIPVPLRNLKPFLRAFNGVTAQARTHDGDAGGPPA